MSFDVFSIDDLRPLARADMIIAWTLLFTPLQALDAEYSIEPSPQPG